MTEDPTKTGILLVDKPTGLNSFRLVQRIRRITGIRKVGHAGTLDPFASGLMILMVGKAYTKQSDQFLGQDKEYIARLTLGQTTDSFDCDGEVTSTSDSVPTLNQVEEVISHFQGTISQIPPMFSAKKVNGKKLYQLARQGVTIERQPVQLDVATTLLDYTYPYIDLRISCSKGTYIRSLAHDIGQELGCGATLITLKRSRVGNYTLDQTINGELLEEETFDLSPHLLR